MHIITGLLMAHLYKRRQDRQVEEEESVEEPVAPLLRLCEPVRTVHRLPGRVRFRVPCLCGDGARSQHLQETLGGVRSVQSIHVNTVTGSVLIDYDPELMNAALLVAAIIKILGLEGELARVPTSRLQHELRQVSQSLNRALYDQTNGLLDVKTAVFLSLAALGTAKLWHKGALALPAGFTLLWWASNGLLRKQGELE